ncbi:hypothetical protein GIB67_003962 [Kingdonia uniflora]|uniref:Uncharacterized protein n=1 Tax=Kingdonia uniflora TaxID=39325 RepID=A0A7J7NRK9_9MAGN|nr:hypothetical protein GIB67_003962 [Kingdonia uniflora]
MDIGSWCSSSCRSMRWSKRYVRSDHGELETLNSSSTTTSIKPRLRLLWKKLKKEKRKIFYSSGAQVPYNSYTYAQNFDQDMGWDEPDNLSRSFSARFADPSRMFQRNGVMV